MGIADPSDAAGRWEARHLSAQARTAETHERQKEDAQSTVTRFCDGSPKDEQTERQGTSPNNRLELTARRRSGWLAVRVRAPQLSRSVRRREKCHETHLDDHRRKRCAE